MDGHNRMAQQYCDIKNTGQHQHSEIMSCLNTRDHILRKASKQGEGMCPYKSLCWPGCAVDSRHNSICIIVVKGKAGVIPDNKV